MKPCNCEDYTLKKLLNELEDNRLPFIEEKISDTIKIRKFDPSYPEYLFKWHWDEEDRFIKALNENDWYFQFDNEFPIKLDREIFIEKGRYHRLIKGECVLLLQIKT